MGKPPALHPHGIRAAETEVKLDRINPKNGSSFFNAEAQDQAGKEGMFGMKSVDLELKRRDVEHLLFHRERAELVTRFPAFVDSL